jgi:transcriptional regulator with XRE-family HTH domain
MEKFAVKLGLTSGTILRWERGQDKRLSQINEYAVRGFVSEVLAMAIPIKFSDLSEGSKTPERLVVDWRLGSQKKRAG